MENREGTEVDKQFMPRNDVNLITQGCDDDN